MPYHLCCDCSQPVELSNVSLPGAPYPVVSSNLTPGRPYAAYRLARADRYAQTCSKHCDIKLLLWNLYPEMKSSTSAHNRHPGMRMHDFNFSFRVPARIVSRTQMHVYLPSAPCNHLPAALSALRFRTISWCHFSIDCAINLCVQCPTTFAATVRSRWSSAM